MEKDLCNQVQLVRKLNHLPTNQWSNSSFQQNGHSTTLMSAGKTIELLSASSSRATSPTAAEAPTM